MAGSSLLALIDDITSVLDDVAVLTKTAAVKTTGVMGDDLALNAQQVSGVHVDRELPVVWAVAKGSFINKLILVPAALAISAFFPPAIMPLMMIGGLFLCYEGFEKVAHKVLHRDGEEAAHHQAHLQALTDPTAGTVDVIAIEKEKIKGAIRTDFVLSAEIVVITLGTMSGEPMLQQVLALSAVAIAATVLVYGLVGGIVKLDDLGVALQARAGAGARRIGGWILRAAPVMMKTLSFLGTAAMFTVGGSIIAHGIPAIEHLIHGIVEPVAARSGILGTIMTTLLDALVGLVAGGLAVALMAGVQRLRRGRRALGVALFGATTALAACQPASARPEPVSPAGAANVPGVAAAPSLASATQLVIVTTSGWDSTTGELRRFTRTSVDAPWRADGSAVPIVVGRTGLAWGVGFDRPGPRKVEGDGRAPAGVFPFETAFGFAPPDSMRWLHLPYMPLTPNTECVDDTASAHYNTVLERDAVQAVDWTSSERMRRIPQYRLGLVVGYNTSPRVKGRGSCIFFHIWEGPRSPTVGCTALDATALTTLMGWLDPRARPVVVQLPAAVLQEVREEWGLPALAAG